MLSSVPPEIAMEIEARTGSAITAFSSASGGCINHAGTCKTQAGSFFLKWNDQQKFPRMFEAEARGLSLLKRSTTLHVPDVIQVGTTVSHQFVLLENIEEGRRASDYWKRFGVGLALLHRTSGNDYGLDHDNYIGSLRQFNKATPSWVDFFIEQRLRKQLRLAIDDRKVDDRVGNKFETLFKKLPNLLADEPPSLLHGDLWGGNIMTNAKGQPSLIDPAVYFGNREVDLAMTRLFGGFDETFIDHYKDTFPLLPGYEERFDLYNLYPLLVHVNLFGGGYARQVEATLDQFL
ncbi:MAG TPA: fructosamine kinase family protein [Chryseosolibacter sp.]|nr:fructosamine kinase family protein [Chryseosolibacter sp.]